MKAAGMLGAAASSIGGIDSMQVLRQNLSMARGFKPVPEQEAANGTAALRFDQLPC